MNKVRTFLFDAAGYTYFVILILLALVGDLFTLGRYHLTARRIAWIGDCE